MCISAGARSRHVTRPRVKASHGSTRVTCFRQNVQLSKRKVGDWARCFKPDVSMRFSANEIRESSFVESLTLVLGKTLLCCVVKMLVADLFQKLDF